MRSLGFEAPGELMTDEHSVFVDIYTETPGGDDPDGNPLPPQKQYFAQNAGADLQPRSGSERAAQSGTSYESTHVLFLGSTPQPIPAGAMVDVRREEGGAVVARYVVVFPANFGTHLQLDLKAV